LRAGGEWQGGIENILCSCSDLREHPYLLHANRFVKDRRYPAGWWFVANQLASRTSNVTVDLTDTSEAVADQYRDSRSIAPTRDVVVRFDQADGFSRIQEDIRADLVFIDPPFHPDADADWEALGKACNKLLRQSISFLVWYPIYWCTKPQRLSDTTGCRSWETTWAEFGPKPSQNLKGCGMLASPDLSTLPIDGELQKLANCLRGTFQRRDPSSG
jgi:23S rRNA A2030 N6-methylase RlmJ